MDKNHPLHGVTRFNQALRNYNVQLILDIAFDAKYDEEEKARKTSPSPGFLPRSHALN